MVLTVFLVIEITTLMNMMELIDNIKIWEMYTCLLIKVEYIYIYIYIYDIRTRLGILGRFFFIRYL